MDFTKAQCVSSLGVYRTAVDFQFLNILSSTASLYRLALSVQRYTPSPDQYNMAAKCILSIYSQPFRCHLLTYCLTLSSLIERPVRKHHILSIHCEVGGGKNICICRSMYCIPTLTIKDFYRPVTATLHTRRQTHRANSGTP